jgi:hypothetical protein
MKLVFANGHRSSETKEDFYRASSHYIVGGEP